MIKKKAQSTIIATVLLVLFVLVAGMFLSTFAINFVKDQMSKSDCFDITNELEITNNVEYTCYNSGPGVMSVQVKIGEIRSEISGIKIEINEGAEIYTYDILASSIIENGPLLSTVSIPHPLDDDNLPRDNGAYTYRISNIGNKPDVIRVYAILNDNRICDESESVTFIEDC